MTRPKRTRDFKIEIGEVFKDDKRHLKVLSREYSTRISHAKPLKVYQCHCLVCGWSDCWITEYEILRGQGCSCCHGKTVVQGINDIPTTAPWMVKYFQGGYEEAKLYTKTSNQKIVPVCPHCKKTSSKPKKISSIYTDKTIGCICGDGISYPEKFLSSLLLQLKIFVEHQYSPIWSQCKRYDFYVPFLNTIIETHGSQHYKNSGFSTYENQYENDLLKFDLSVINGIEHYVVLDCRHSNPDWIKNSIMSSKLPELLGFKEEDIDWVECDKCSQANLVKEVCDYKRSNPQVTVKELANLFNIKSTTTVRTYLNKGVELGWCDYNAKNEGNVQRAKGGLKNGKRVNIYKNGVLLNEEPFPSARALAHDSLTLYGVQLDNVNISACCRGIRKTHGGFTFKYAE